MKDAYSFDASWEGLDQSYEKHDQAYRNIFDRCGIKYFVVGASSGAMGGSKSEEFMVKSEAGEDTVAFCECCNYAANIEVAESVISKVTRDGLSREVYEISTPNIRSIDELCEFLDINERETAKSRVYIFEEEAVLVLMSGNEEVNETKLETVLGGEVRPAHPEELVEITGAEAGSIGPVGFDRRIIADNKLKGGTNLYSGANKTDFHIGGIDLEHDVPKIEYSDLRMVETGEKCIKCGEELEVFKAIELGHIFKLGIKYSEAMGANFLNENGQAKPIIMGSYGIGVERVLACYIEQNFDEKGIIWNGPLKPFDIHLIGLNMKKELVEKESNNVYNELIAEDYDVLFDDRKDAQAGFKFNDAELIGIPVQVIIGEKNIKEGLIEIKKRESGEKLLIDKEHLLDELKKLVSER
jgi:prolyl-tRNA synthetase